MFIYDRDFFFYLSPSAAKYRDALEYALITAKESGLMDELVRKYWVDDFHRLDYDGRVKIYLETPD